MTTSEQIDKIFKDMLSCPYYKVSSKATAKIVKYVKVEEKNR